MNAYNQYFDRIEVPADLHEKLLQGAAPARRRTPRRLAAALACCGLLALVVAVWPALFNFDATPRQSANPPASDTAPESATPPESDGPLIVNGDEEKDEEKNSFMIDADCAMPQSGEVFMVREVRNALRREQNSEALFFVAIDICENGSTLYDADKATAEIERLQALGYRIAWSPVTAPGPGGVAIPYLNEIFLGGLFTREELENFEAPPEYGYFIQFPIFGDVASEPDLSLFGLADESTLTVELPPLEDYVATNLPEGFELSGSSYQNTSTLGTVRIDICWSRGGESGDFIDCIITYLMESDVSLRLVAADERERYDRTLYTKDDLWAMGYGYPQNISYDEPIFPLDELTPEVVSRCGFTGQDRPVLHFGVLYGDYVVVDFHTRGVTVDELYPVVTALRP